jgi:hypothetical protein
MPEPEQILGKLESYGLFFTDKQFVFLNAPVKPQYMPVGSLLGWGVSYLLYRSKKKKAKQKQEEIKDLPLDEKLQKNQRFLCSTLWRYRRICIEQVTLWWSNGY